MSTRYVLESRRWPHAWGNRRTVRRSSMLLALGRFTLLGFLFRLRGRGGDFGPYLKRFEIIRRVARRTAFNEFGYRVFVNRRRDGKTLSIHKVEHVPPVPDLGCHLEIARAFASLVARFGTDGISNGGIYYCRFVDGRPGLVSYHGYRGSGWLGAAGDAFSSPDNMDALYERARHLVRECQQGRLRLDRIICGDDSWESDGGWAQPHYYSGVYHRHVHFEVHAGGPCTP